MTAHERAEAIEARRTPNGQPRVVALAWRFLVVLSIVVAVLLGLVIWLLIEVRGLKNISENRHVSICAIQEAVGAPKVGECR